jgi:O-methyltransferase involved in polyketide biosynthesis
MKEEIVQETNNDALVCKLSCINQNYLTDKFTKFFLKKFERKPPIINRGTFLRVTGIDEKISEFVTKYKDGNIISLGAGSDARYFIMKSNRENPGLYVEIDYSQITAKKAMVICKNAQMKGLLDNVVIGNVLE